MVGLDSVVTLNSIAQKLDAQVETVAALCAVNRIEVQKVANIRVVAEADVERIAEALRAWRSRIRISKYARSGS